MVESSPKAATRSAICVSVTATTVKEFIAEIATVEAAGADIVELRLDFLQDFDTERDLAGIQASCKKPYIVTYRPKWEGGLYEGPEPQRLATLKLAAIRGAPHVDVEFKAARLFFASKGEVPLSCKVILSSHNFQITPPASELHALASAMHEAGADIIKIATMANDIADSARVLSLLNNPIAPTVALAMGEKGVITRLLASKFGGYLTFATLSQEKASAPGQPHISYVKDLCNFHSQGPQTKVFGIIGNPVSHSRSPLIHNTAFQHTGFDGVYVPLLVDDLARFLEAFKDFSDFQGFSVTIPHKEPALAAASEVDSVAGQIGAVNTVIRQGTGSWKGYNTDWSAAIEAIEKELQRASPTPPPSSSPSPSSSPPQSPLQTATGQPCDDATTSSSSTVSTSPLGGKSFLVLGAGGAGRALAFGAASRGARVLIANRNKGRAEQLAASLAPAFSAEVVSWEDLQAGKVSADVVANTTAVGMAPNATETPVPAAFISNFALVFDAVYTPVWTQLLLDAKDADCLVVDGLQMFVLQAVRQFELFTGLPAPQELMQQTLVQALGAATGSPAK